MSNWIEKECKSCERARWECECDEDELVTGPEYDTLEEEGHYGSWKEILKGIENG